MKYIVAVSGGVDSVVLLDLLVRSGHDVVVAHVDHGMRLESASDARFVAALAKRYGVPCEEYQAALGEGASEATARQARYAFLFDCARRHGGQLATAHHRDDVVETIALNVQRGTRWRGLANMNHELIARPLAGWTKADMYDYAAVRRLEWVEDASNNTLRYTRNRLRRRISAQLSKKSQWQLYELWRQQRRLRRAITAERVRLAPLAKRRYTIIMMPESVAKELLYYAAQQQTGVSLMAPQLDRAWLAIKTGRPGTTWQLAHGVRMKLSATDVIIERVD